MIWWKRRTDRSDPEPQPAVTTEQDNTIHPERHDQEGGIIGRLKAKLKNARESLSKKIDTVVARGRPVDQELLEELEEALIMADVGVNATSLIMARITEVIKKQRPQDSSKVQDILKDELVNLLTIPAHPLDPSSAKPFVIMVTGVNGVGKTTTIAKLANYWKNQNFSPLLVAADTFRAAAIDQLVLWGERIRVPVIKQQPGADPSAVVYDALEAAISRKHDLVIVDTAGRMHTRVNLMEELKKINRVISKKLPGAPHETLLVIDATTGQNALSQARLFKEAVGISGLVVTKLDGTAKGGTVIALCHELGVPIRFIGVGEGLDDIEPFDPVAFVEALLG
ncbi:signal recognition particle-docking protein FtsY [Thermodesulforhabdus norvegica]|uniref:Signal recognition particle receptor FtsY n=1 Tax=Thermodesulforhabdus norvegica TaxID=39841 RepID=A0A1I4SPW3_9BACT|nr:signal recognition particle-docking protein FtsY [Thermodesulforhabdus norvegica]SFM66558.1 signal recognition particle-docking protein FtsY [Thermodesulforhabdus norvegica]